MKVNFPIATTWASKLDQWQDKEYNNANELAEMVVRFGVRSYFQDRGYFKVLAHDPVTQLLAVRDGKQQVLVRVAVTPGQQYRLGRFRSVPRQVTTQAFRQQPSENNSNCGKMTCLVWPRSARAWRKSKNYIKHTAFQARCWSRSLALTMRRTGSILSFKSRKSPTSRRSAPESLRPIAW